MADNEFMIRLLAELEKSKSKVQINKDIKELEKIINSLRLTAVLAKGDSKKILNQNIKQLESQLSHVKLRAKLDQKNLKSEINKALNNLSFKDIEIGVTEGKTKLKVQKVIADAQKIVQNNPISLNIELKKDKLSNQLTTYLTKNSKIRESEVLLKEADKIREKISAINDKNSLRNATDSFQLFKSSVSATGFATKSTTDKVAGLVKGITKVGSLFGVASIAVNNFQKSLKTIKTNDSILTEISKVSDSTKKQLEELGKSSFNSASKYGQISSDYLKAVQEMNRSGFYDEKGKALGELVLKTEAAGNVTSETAQKYLLATNAAYGYRGSIEKLNAVLDGQNLITNRSSVEMETMAIATEKAGSVAANSGIKINELSAMIGTVSARTKEAGEKTGTGIKSLIVNLQNISSDKIVKTLKKANASMTETVDGVEKLRNPIEILKDLAKTYNSLDAKDPLKSEITTNIGQKYHANQLAALLSGWSDYEKMLKDYSEGIGSSEIEAKKTADSLQGRLNALQNSWDSLVNSITSKSAIKGGVSFFDGLIKSAEVLIDTFDAIPVAISGITAAMTAINKDYGITQVINPETKKMDVQGNLFGIDITQIKQQKKHFEEASSAIQIWNNKLVNGVTDIASFNNETVKNNAQLKAYLKTCSADAPASLNGYKSYLNAAGISTDALRVKTILLNTAISFGLGMAIQGVVSLIANMTQRTNELHNKASELGSEFSGTTSDIDSYKDKIVELQKVINDSGSSIEDVTDARKQLMTIQNELINKYGKEESKIKAITSAINGQVGALENLKKAEWYDTKSDYNKKTTDDHVIEFITKTIPYYFEKAMLFGDNGKKELPKSKLDNMLDEWNNQEYSLDSTGNQKLDDLIAKSLGISLENGKFKLGGSINDLKDDLSRIKEIVGSYEVSSDFEESLNQVSNDVKEIYENDSNMRNQSILFDVVLSEDPDNVYDELYEKIKSAKDRYDEAILDGDESKIISAADSYAKVVSDAMQTALNNDDFDVADYFENMYPELKEKVSQWRFEVSFKANTGNIKNQVEDSLKVLSGFSLEDLQQFNANTATKKQIEAFGGLTRVAKIYGLSIEQLLILLQQLGVVQTEKYQELVKLFGKDNIEKIAPKDLEFAYKIKNAGSMTFEEFQEAIKKTKEEAKQKDILSFSELWADETEELKTKLLDLAKSGNLTLNTFKNTEGADKFIEKLKEMGISAKEAKAEIQNLLTIQEKLAGFSNGMDTFQSAFKEFEEFNFVSAETLVSLSERFGELDGFDLFSKIVGDPTSGKEKIKKAFNDIVTEYLKDQNTLVGVTEETKNAVIANLKKDGVQNAEEVVNSYISEAKKSASLIEKAEEELFSESSKKRIKDLNAFKKALANKNTSFKEASKILGKNNALLINSLGKQYKDDYINWVELCDKKIQAYNSMIDAINKAGDSSTIGNPLVIDQSNAFKQKYGMTPEQYVKKYSLTNSLSNMYKTGQSNAAILMEATAIINNEKATKAANDAENKLVKFQSASYNPDYLSYKPTTSNSSKNKSSKSKANQTAEEFDFIEVKLNNVADAAAKAKEKIDEFFSFDAKKNQIEKAITAVKKAMNDHLKASKLYQAEADKIAKLSTKSTIKSATNAGKTIVQSAKEYVGKLKYVWGGTSLTNGADCSGFTQQIFKKNGINIERTAQQQYNTTKGVKITNKSKLKAGDLVFFGDSAKKISHVGIYAGNGKFVHSPHTGEKVKVSNLSTRKNFVGGIRADALSNVKTIKIKGISSSTIAKYVKLIQEGKLSSDGIVKIKNDKLKDVLKEYQKYYEKAKKAKEEATAFKKQLKELQTVTKYQNYVDTGENNLNRLNAKIDIATTASKKIALEKSKYKWIKQSYNYQIKIAKAEKDSLKVAQLRAEKEKAILDTRKQILQHSLDENAEKRDYLDAKFENATTTAEKSKIRDSRISTYKADNKAYDNAYKSAVGSRKTKGTTVSKSVSKLKTPLSEKDTKSIANYINKGKKVPDKLLKKVKEVNPSLYNKLVEYNKTCVSTSSIVKGLKKSKVDKSTSNSIEKSLKASKKVSSSTIKKVEKKDTKTANALKAWNKNIGLSSTVSKSKYLTSSDKKKITSFIKSGKTVPKSLLDKVKKVNPSLYNDLVLYNQKVDEVKDALNQRNTDKERNEASIREEQNGKNQDKADEASAKIEANRALESNTNIASERNKYEKENRTRLKEQYDNLIAIAKRNGQNTEAKRLQAEYEKEIADSYATEFENIKNEYDLLISLNDAKNESVQSKIDALQAQGKKVSETLYDSMIFREKDNINQKLFKKNKILAELHNYDYGTDNWFNAMEELESIDSSIANSTKSIAEFQKAINDLKFEKFSLINRQLDATTDHIKFLIDMLSHSDLTDSDEGGLTKEGLATASLYLTQMQKNDERKTNALNEWAEFQRKVRNGESLLSPEEITAKNNEYAQSIRDCISENENLKESIKGLVKDSFSSYIDALNKLIEKRKKALDNASDLRSYQRQIKDQTKQINDIKKQIAALMGDASDEARAKIQKLNVELEKSKQDLEDTEYERWKSDQMDMLDNMSEEIQEFFDNSLKDTNNLIQGVIDAVNANPTAITEALSVLGLGDANSVRTETNEDGSTTTIFTDYNGGTSSFTTNSDGNLVTPDIISSNPVTSFDGIVNFDSLIAKRHNEIQTQNNKALDDFAKNTSIDSAIKHLNGNTANTIHSSKNNNSNILTNGGQDGLPLVMRNLISDKKKKLKKFKTGGLITGDDSDDNLVLRAANKERVLTQEQNGYWEKWTEAIPDIVNKLNYTNVPDLSSFNNIVPNAKRDNGVNVGDVIIHLDGSKVVDADSLVDVIQHNSSVQTTIQKASIGQIEKVLSNRLTI